jgi:hypothetical protein
METKIQSARNSNIDRCIPLPQSNSQNRHIQCMQETHSCAQMQIPQKLNHCDPVRGHVHAHIRRYVHICIREIRIPHYAIPGVFKSPLKNDQPAITDVRERENERVMAHSHCELPRLHEQGECIAVLLKRIPTCELCRCPPLDKSFATNSSQAEGSPFG